MLPLRFPNSGIRAKAARKKGGRPWPGPLQGWLATASHGLATHKGADDCGKGQPVREVGGARKGQQPTWATLVGRSDARKGCRLSLAGAMPTCGQSAEVRRPWRCHPREWSRPQGRPPLGRTAASGQGSRHPHRGGDDSGTEGARGLGHSF
ncbi:hypothetical protein B296_00007512 [Ensete ventricosum]|uniref:Uncharacterized protein n=1 Tax=Ensete ventricosum TaxID=4639 RepID=A0A427ATQ7_ENSVE|nr:hypothetical protein B296_00007512 [Ensete ventricosum]